MSLVKEIWLQDVVEGLYEDNSFMRYAIDASHLVKDGTIVHIPNASSGSGVVKNRTQFPAEVQVRNDNEVVYVLDNYTTNPIKIPYIDNIQYAYDKRASHIREDIRTLSENVADGLLMKWSQGVAGVDYGVIRTSGATTAATLSGTSGQRKAFTKEDLLKAKTLLNKQKVPRSGRVALLPSDMMERLQSDRDLLLRDYASEVDVKAGQVSRLWGFDLLERGEVARYATDLTAKELSDIANTDCNAALCWQSDGVEVAKGTIDMFERTNDPLHYGDIYSFIVLMGGRRRRFDNKGFIAIVEGTVA